jgi:hypothetical protein
MTLLLYYCNKIPEWPPPMPCPYQCESRDCHCSHCLQCLHSPISVVVAIGHHHGSSHCCVVAVVVMVVGLDCCNMVHSTRPTRAFTKHTDLCGSLPRTITADRVPFRLHSRPPEIPTPFLLQARRNPFGSCTFVCLHSSDSFPLRT